MTCRTVTASPGYLPHKGYSKSQEANAGTLCGSNFAFMRLVNASVHSLIVLLLSIGVLLCANVSQATTTTNRAAEFEPTMTMKAMLSDGTGKLELGEAPKPTPSGREILIEVFASGINRIDTYMMKGAFGRVPVLGMEVSGRVVALGPDAGQFKVGDSVLALLSDSGHAEFAVVDERHAMTVPKHLSFAHAAAIPEQWLTAFQLLHLVGEVQKGDRVLIHAGASGVGTTAIQLCRLAGAVPFVTAGSAEKIEKCKAVGAEDGFNYKDTEHPWHEGILAATEGKGVDVILDCVGGTHANGNVAVLATDARWVLFGLMGGRSLPSGENFLGNIMRKRASLRSTTLRMRSKEYKGHLVQRFSSEILPHIGWCPVVVMSMLNRKSNPDFNSNLTWCLCSR